MKHVKVCNVTRNTVLGERIRLAESFVSRAIGLMAAPSLPPGEGLWLKSCTSVHTFFMRFPIDILFIDDNDTVLAQQTIVPWRVSSWHKKSQSVLELPAGTAERTGTMPGDRIKYEGLPAGRQV